jgi:hypothetical protein
MNPPDRRARSAWTTGPVRVRVRAAGEGMDRSPRRGRTLDPRERTADLNVFEIAFEVYPDALQSA